MNNTAVELFCLFMVGLKNLNFMQLCSTAPAWRLRSVLFMLYGYVVKYYGRIFIQSYFSLFVLPIVICLSPSKASVRSKWRELSCDSQSHLGFAMRRPSKRPSTERKRHKFLCYDWLRTWQTELRTELNSEIQLPHHNYGHLGKPTSAK